MSLLDSTFERVQEQLRSPQTLNPARSDRVFYFVHPADETLEVKRRIPLWVAKLRHDGWNVTINSLAAIIWDRIDRSGRWQDWLSAEPESELAEINESIRDVLRGKDGLIGVVADLVSRAEQHQLLFLTDAGLLHPYFRIRSLETALHDRVKVPTVIFYPGRRSGQYGLHFLGFYPVDPDYRSALIGGEA